MGGIGRYHPCRYCRRAVDRRLLWRSLINSTGLDASQGAMLRSAHAIWHMALPVIQLLSTFYPGEEKLIVNPPAGAGPIPAGAPGRSPARVKYIAQRA